MCLRTRSKNSGLRAKFHSSSHAIKAAFARSRRCARIWKSRWRNRGVIAGCVLTCTKHLWSWDLQTLEMQGETEKPLKTYEVKVEGDDLMAFVEEELLYDFDDEDEMDDDDFFNS